MIDGIVAESEVQEGVHSNNGSASNIRSADNEGGTILNNEFNLGPNLCVH